MDFAGYSPRSWQHVAASFHASTTTLTLYLNGVQVAQQRQNARSTTGSGLPLQIGRLGPATGTSFLGKIDDLRLWNVVRSASDIKTNFQHQLGSVQPGLIANWLFDDGDGTAALDSAGVHPATLILARRAGSRRFAAHEHAAEPPTTQDAPGVQAGHGIVRRRDSTHRSLRAGAV